MAYDRSADTATVDGMNDKDSLQRALDSAFDKHLNQYPLVPGEKREVRFAAWTKQDPVGNALLAKVVAATTRPAEVPADQQTAIRQAEIQRGAEIAITKSAQAVIADAAKHGVRLSVEKARTMVRKVQRGWARAELGIPMTEEEEE